MEETTFAENRFSLKEPLSLSLLLGSESDGHRSNGKKKKGRERGTRSFFFLLWKPLALVVKEARDVFPPFKVSCARNGDICAKARQ